MEQASIFSSHVSTEKFVFSASESPVATNEPFVFYEGFKLGFGITDETRRSLEHALEIYPQVIILIDDSHFSEMLFAYLQRGQLGLKEHVHHTTQKSGEKKTASRKTFELSELRGSEKLLKSFFKKTENNDRPDALVFEQAKMQLSLVQTERTQLASTLPKSFSHPALAFIRDSLEGAIYHELAPRIVEYQLKRWKLLEQDLKTGSANLRAFTKTALEKKVDTAEASAVHSA